MITKRGISAIVATVLIVLITVAAVTIIWTSIIPMLRENLDFNDPNMRFDIVSSKGYTFYDSSSHLLYVQVERGADIANVVGLEIVVTIEGNSITKEYGPEYVPAPNQAKTLILDLGAGSSLPETIKVVPIVNTEGTLKQGSATSQGGSVPVGKAAVGAVPTPTVGETGACTTAAQCGDSNSCTTDACVSEACTHTAITSCSTTSDGCCPGSCNPTNDADCAGCTSNASCPADSYVCSGLNRMLDDNYCVLTGGYVCRVTQTFANNCNDSNECTTDSCAVGGCSNVAVANGVSCSGGAGTCQAGVCSVGTLEGNMLLFWRFENVWTSTVGSKTLGLYNGAPVFNSSGKYGSAASFGPALGYAKTSSVAITSGLNNVSFGGWVKIDRNNSVNGYEVVMAQDDGSDSGFEMYSYNAAEVYYIGCYEGMTCGVEKVIKKGTWNHVFCVHNGTRLKMYLNGTLVDSCSTAIGAPNANFTIGSTISSYDYQMDGLVDEVMIFNKSLSVAEIGKLYNNQYTTSSGKFYWL
jgi:hypothetical protein